MKTIDVLEEEVSSDIEYGFEINAPKGWVLVDDSNPWASVFQLALRNPEPDYEGENDAYANLGVMVESNVAPNELCLKDLIKDIKNIWTRTLTNLDVIEEKSLIVNGVQARIIRVTYVMGVFHLHGINLIILNKKKRYCVQATTLEKDWGKYQNLIESSLLTFKLV